MSECDVIYYEGVWNGEPAYFNRTFRGHLFTIDECRALMKGEAVQVHGLQGRGTVYAVEGQLSSSGIRLDGKLMLQFHSEKVVPNNPDYEFGRATSIYDLLEPEQHAFEESVAQDETIPEVVLDDSDLEGISFETEPSSVDWPEFDRKVPFMKQISNMLDNELAQFRHGTFGQTKPTENQSHTRVSDKPVDANSQQTNTYAEKEDMEHDVRVSQSVVMEESVSVEPVTENVGFEEVPDFLEELSLDDIQNDIQSGFEDEMRDSWQNPFDTEEDATDASVFVAVEDEDPFAGLSDEEIDMAEGREPTEVEEPLPEATSVSMSEQDIVVNEQPVEHRTAMIRENYPDFFRDDEYDDDVADIVSDYIAHSLDEE